LFQIIAASWHTYSKNCFGKISAHSLDKSKLKRNKRYVDAGNLCFASKELASADLITGLQMIGNKSQLNRFLEPYGLLKIGMFDLWVDNVDRGKNENYNLLMEAVEMEQENNNMTKKRTMFRWVAFDHAFAFGGVDRLRMFNETMQPTKNKKLVESPYFKSYIKHLNKKTALNIVRNFLNLTPNEIKDIIDNVFSQLPEMWQTPASLSSRMSRFLADPQRLKTVKHLTISTIK